QRRSWCRRTGCDNEVAPQNIWGDRPSCRSLSFWRTVGRGCLLLEVKRTSAQHCVMSFNDPKPTLSSTVAVSIGSKRLESNDLSPTPNLCLAKLVYCSGGRIS